MSRRVLAIVIAVVAAMTMASASSLGSLTNVSLWGTAGDKEACHVADPATDVTFYDGTGNVVELLTGLVGSLLGDIEEIQLTDLDGDCAGMRPVVVVIGYDGFETYESVLSRTELASIDGTTDNVRLPVSGSDEINSLLSLSADQPTEVRVGFCPDSVLACGVAP